MTETRTQAGRLTFGIVLLVAGALWLLVALDVVDLAWQTALAIGLVLVGVAVLVVGRHGGLITLGVVLTVLLALAAMVNVPLEGGVGEREHAPVSAVDVRDEYRLALGKMTVDLSRIDPGDLPPVITATVGMGELQVILPPGTGAVVEGEAGAGEVLLLGSREAGVSVSIVARATGEGSLRLVVEVGFGKVEVR